MRVSSQSALKSEAPVRIVRFIETNRKPGNTSFLPRKDYTVANQIVDQTEKHVREQDVSFHSLLSNPSSENLVLFYI